MVSNEEAREFLDDLWEYYEKNSRDSLPWRQSEPDGSFDPYKILVSELMLQQTQVARVIPKYEAFLRRFPTAKKLAVASLGDVLRTWQGLGYNRRAKYLWMAAKQIATHGWPEDLTTLPGVGVNTAGAIRAYAYNEPVVFVETNIRTVFIHHFAADQQDIPDSLIRDLLSQTLEVVVGQGKRAAGQNVNDFAGSVGKNAISSHEPRVFYWALMDYGSFLKPTVRNLSQSKHYQRQSAFHGSRRQIRGFVIRELSKQPRTFDELAEQNADERLSAVLDALESEGLIVKHGEQYYLSP